MKKIFSVFMCFTFLAACLGGIPASAEFDNLLWNPVVWCTSAQVINGEDLVKLTDGSRDTSLPSAELGAATTWRIFLDTAPDGSTVPAYNKLKLYFDSYNAMKISVYTASEVYNSRGTQVTEPPAESGTSTVRFANYTNPAGTVNFTPYYISVEGADYPEIQALSFETRNDRFLCVEITTAYDSRTSGEYYQIHNILSEIELGYCVPERIAVSSNVDSVAIPSALMPDKTVAFSAAVLDGDGDRIMDSGLSAYTFGLDGEYEGVTLDAQTGILTVSNTAPITDVTVTASCICEGFEYVSGSKTISLTEVDMTEKTLAEAAEMLTFSLLSEQRINSVGKDLTLPTAENGVLRLGTAQYPGMDVSWTSSNPEVISNTGSVTRPEEENTVVTLTATLSMSNKSDDEYTVEKAFEITVIKAGELVDMVNIMLGGYGWVAAGWGAAVNAIDGKLSTYWSLGNHSYGNIEGGLKTASGETEKYNKVVLYFFAPEKMESYMVMGYETVVTDPGSSQSSKFLPGSGKISVASYDAKNPATWPDEQGKVVIKLPETQESRYFGITIQNINAAANACGVYEFEVYYATPFDVELTDPDTVLYVPAKPGTASFDLPSLTACDEAGDELAGNFEHSISLAQNYPGVTLENGKINLSYGCSVDEIGLVYKSWDEDKVWLNKTVTVPVKTYTQDYYDIFETGNYLDGYIKEIVETDIALPAEYNGAQIAWSSSDERVVSASGKVTRPLNSQKDAEVVLNAVITKGEFSITKTFPIVVIKEMTDGQRASADANRIELGISGTVSSNISLPLKGYYGSTITWSSSKSNIISDSGVYNRITSSGSTETVVLHASVIYNGEKAEKDFVVYAQTDKQSAGGGGSGNSGGSNRTTTVNVSGADTQETLTPLTEEEIAQGQFVDITSGHWAKKYIEELAAKKIVSGVDGGHFEPDRTVTREEFLKMVIGAFGITRKPGNTEFSDIQSGAWYEDYVVTAYKEGLINGVSDTEFGVGQNITREDMAVIMERVLARLEVDFIGNVKTFQDAGDISDYAASAVNNLTMVGVLSGDEAGNFQPKKFATRAEAAKILFSAMEKGGVI